jgi:hypothetical protein
MLQENDIRIIYLKHLLREPLEQEIITSQTFQTKDGLASFLKETFEYKFLNNLFSYDYHFNNDTNVYTISNFAADYSKGFNITNGTIGIESSFKYNRAKKTTFKDNGKEINAFDFTNITFLSSNVELVASGTSQSLDMNNCKFLDTFTLGEAIQSTIEKFPLHTYSGCFLQKVALLSPQNIDLVFSHNFNEQLEFTTYTLPMQIDTVNHFSQLNGKELNLTNVYSFHGDFEYLGYDTLDKIIKNTFTIYLKANVEYNIYILSCTTVNSKNVDIVEYLKNIKRHSDDTIIDNHIIAWNKKWNTTITIDQKESLRQQDNLITKIIYIIKSTLFNIFSDVFISEYVYYLPILILLKPSLAKHALTYLIQGYTENLSLFNSSLLGIHIWNYFRTSRDKQWLQTIGFPTMLIIADRIYDFLTDNSINYTVAITQMNTTNNALTNYMFALALTYSNQAIYELDYLYIEKYKTIADSLALQYFTDNKFIQPVDTRILIKLGQKNKLFHYEFYDSHSNLLGFQFGGESGYKFSLLDNTEYEFTAHESLVNHPIKFVDHLNKSVHLSTSNVVLNSTDLKGYAFFSESNFYSTFRDNFNHLYGDNAFTTHTLTNVIVPYEGYTFETLHHAEPYILFNSYYNNNKFNQTTNFLDIMNDNISYYTDFSSNNAYNSLLEGGLNGLLSQYEPRYVNKRTQMNHFYHKLITTVDEDDPWNNTQNSLMTLFVVITCLFELAPQGETTKDRIIYKPYGLQYIKRNVLPDPFKQMSITNVGTDNKLCTINNSLYVDNPFNISIEGIRYDMLFDETNNVLTIEPDFANIFPSGVPDNVSYKILIDSMSTVLVDGEAEPFHYSMTEVKTSPNASTSNIVIPYTPITTTTVATENVKLEQFYNKILYIYLNNNGNESMTFTEYSILQTKPTNTPTVYGTLSFDSDNLLKMDMVFNSHDKTYYSTFDDISININYDGTVIDDGISYDGGAGITDYGFNVTSNNYIQESRFNIELTNTTSYVSANHSLGTITLPLRPGSMTNLGQIANPVLLGTITSKQVEKPIIVTNPDVFPPLMYTISNLPTDFVYYPTIFQSAYTASDISYYPINTLVSTNIDQLNTLTNINATLINNHIYNIVGNRIFEIRDNIDNTLVEYYGMGFNSNNILMIGGADGGEDEITSLTKCQYLEDFMSAQGAIVKDIVTTTTSTIVIDSLDRVYGIGYNESYNLGIGNSVSTNTLQSCNLINSLGVIKQIVLNDKTTFILLNDNRVFGLGESLMFHYLTESLDHELMILESPTELTRINTFISTNNYTIERVDTGYEHMKFLLKNTDGETEWWGVGRNAFNSMGVGKHINYDFDIKYMTRLHQIERFIHYINYDEHYTGNKLSDSTKYHLIRSKGIPSKFTAILDTLNKDVYVIGSLDDGVSIYSDWTKLYTKTTFDTINPQYYILNNNGLVVGGTNMVMKYL